MEFFEVKNKVGDVHNHQQVAFSVNMDSWTIYITKSGHGKVTRDKAGRNWCGGWIFPSRKKITFTSGSLGKVNPKIQDEVRSSLQYELGMFFKIGA